MSSVLNEAEFGGDREAYTTDIAQQVVAHLVNDRGLQLDLDAVQEAERCSALQNNHPVACAPPLLN
jgi:hypothetical protein